MFFILMFIIDVVCDDGGLYCWDFDNGWIYFVGYNSIVYFGYFYFLYFVF